MIEVRHLASGRRAVSVAVALTTAFTGLTLATPTAAFAATNTNRHDGLIVSTPHDRKVTGSGKVTIKPSVKVKAGAKQVVIKKTITAYADGRRVAKGSSVRLRSGNYKLRVSVAYRPYRMVKKLHTVTSRYDDDYLDGARCTVREAANFPDSDAYYVVRSTCTHPRRPGQTASDEYTSTEAPGPYAVGQVVTASSYVHFPAFTGRRTINGPVRVYGPTKHYSTPKRVLVITRRASGRGGGDGGSSHACTTTSRGTCIQGGQFCPRASYGESGYDASGRRYVCEGDYDHPHWMIP